MEIVPYLVALGIGYVLGKAYTLYRLRALIKTLAKEQGIDIDKELAKYHSNTPVVEVHLLEVQEIENTLYLFDRESKDFVCQGATLEELAKLAKDYKNILVATVLHHDRVFMFVNGNSKEFNG